MKIAVAALLAGLLWTGCARDPGRCCDRFSTTEEAGIYCHAHKDAVLRYVRAAPDAAGRKSRLEGVQVLLKEIEPLQDSDEIHDRLARTEKTRPEFWVEYEKQHFWAGRDTNLGLIRRGELMKCGFRHAVHLLLQEAP